VPFKYHFNEMLRKCFRKRLRKYLQGKNSLLILLRNPKKWFSPPMTSSPTLKKISEHLNISISTVSRALKDHPDVSSETIKRVKDLAGLMEYEPNGFAVNLRKKRSDTYAIIVPEISGYFYHSFIQAIEEEARKRLYGVMIMQTMNDPEIEAQNLKICRYNHVAGVFAAISGQAASNPAFQKTEDSGIPIVFFDKVPHDNQVTSVQIADFEAGALAAAKISECSKKNVLCLLGNPFLSITRLRRSGFEDTWAKTGRQPPAWLYADNEEAAYAIILERCRGNCTDLAIFCMSDEILCGAMRALYELNASIPDHVAIIAMSNGFMPRYFHPTISYVETSGYQLGKLSFTAMEQKRSGALQHSIQEMLHCSFFEGGSLK
jgi:LacI family transcriptional regulator